ncbi:nitrite reductase small subunit NirD [Aquihabitans sp. McL0605]|uniref:nitrite reductase small subunit NirD n=1 Tax=Aquihabitans sp. McL0605 TaxID=3415671 RepID=UPI003CF27F58
MTLIDTERQTWVGVCALDSMVIGRGVAALVDGEAVALFRTGAGTVLAIANLDPCSGASVLSRGLIGQTQVDGEVVTYVASPLRKERFDLVTGACLDGDRRIATWPTRIDGDGTVLVGAEASPPSNGPETTP